MTNYNGGQWHIWNGGECPVHPETVVQVQMENETREQVKAESPSSYHCAREWIWGWDDCNGSNIIAFRVIKEHKEPREFWVCHDEVFGSRVMAENWGAGEIIHVKEVLE